MTNNARRFGGSGTGQTEPLNSIQAENMRKAQEKDGKTHSGKTNQKANAEHKDASQDNDNK